MSRSETSKTPDLRDIKTPGVADQLNAERPTEPGGFVPYAEPMPSAQGEELSSTPAQSPAKSIKAGREKITQHEIKELNTIHHRITRSTVEIIKDMIELGGKLTAVKRKLQHGQWGAWVEQHLEFSIRTATRYMKVYQKRENSALTLNPEAFMGHIYGNISKELEDEETDVQKSKSDVTSDLNNTDEECSEDSDRELLSSRPAKISPEVWSGMQLVKELGKTLDAYLNQPIAETLKLQVLIHAYGILAARLEPQAKKLGLTLEQALGHEYKNL